MLKGTLNDGLPEKTHHPVYHGTYRPAPRQNNNLTLGLQESMTQAPTPQIGSVNVNIKQYHVKATQFQHKLQIQSETKSYNSRGGLTLSSNATTRSYGGGMATTPSVISRSNNVNYLNQSYSYSTAKPQFAYNVPNSLSGRRFTTQNWSGMQGFSYRATGEFEYNDWVLDYISAGGTSGLTDKGDGTYLVTDDWITGMYAYLATIGVVGADPRLPLFNTWWGGQTIYLTGSGTVPPPNIPDDDDQMPVGDGIVILTILGIAYAAYRKKRNRK